MKLFTLLVALLVSAGAHSQNAGWKYIRPSNTGLGGDFYLCVRVDNCGNVWTGGYLPFWSEGSVVRITDSAFTCWSNFEGYLPADRVYDIAFDSYNGLWVATNGVGNGIAHGGISHFDGFTWTTYTSANTPLPEDDMRGIAIDHNNNVWATFLNTGSGIGGVCRFDGSNWTIYTPGPATFPTQYVEKIAVDNANNIWVGTNAGLAKFDGANWTMFDNTNSGIINNSITDVEYDETTNKLYVACGISVDIFDGTSWSHINSTNSPVSATGLWSVDARGDSMIITTVGGTYLTYIYNGQNWITHTEPDHTYDCRIDNAGNFWTAGNASVEKFDGTGWKTLNGKNTGLTSMFNNDVFVDSRNRAWFASSDNGGIQMFDCPEWQDYNPYNSNRWPMPVDYTGSGTGITEDSYGDIWMTFSGVAGAAVQVSGGNVNDTTAWHVWDNNNSGISLQFMNRCAGDHSGNVWFGYEDACSVSKYSHATNQWTNFNLFQLGQNTCGAGSGINSIRVDDSDNVWICGTAGLTKYDQSNWTFYTSLNTPLLQGTVMDVAFDSSGNKWVATENGLLKFDGNTWTKFDHTNTPMIGDMVRTVHVDRDGIVWAASAEVNAPYSGSLCSFDGAVWTQYTPGNSGLQHNSIVRLASDTLGNLWVLSDLYGAALFNPAGVTGYDCIDKTLNTCAPVGIVKNEKPANTFGVYPNPANEIITIDLSGMKNKTALQVSDVTGKIVYQQLLDSEQVNVEINIASLSAGVYEICLINSGTTRNAKLIVE